MDNQHKIAVVTGAAGGFGQEIVRQLLSAGFYVAATDLFRDKLEHLQTGVSSSKKLGLFAMDVCNLDSIEKANEEIRNFFGDDISILVNNAGIYDRTPILDEECFNKVKKIIDTNLIGSYNCTTLFSKIMVKRKYGRIINVASIAGTWGAAFASAYAASKAGMIAASKSWARELGSHGVCVNAITPGICETNMLERAEKEERAFSLQKKMLQEFIPVGRFGNPGDVAEVILFLATCKTDYLNGAIIELDGGVNVGPLETVNLV